jgi:hypothetical protein
MFAPRCIKTHLPRQLCLSISIVDHSWSLVNCLKAQNVKSNEARPWVNFTNVLHTAFMYISCAHSFLCLHFRFVLYRCKTAGAKAARIMLVKLTPYESTFYMPHVSIHFKAREKNVVNFRSIDNWTFKSGVSNSNWLEGHILEKKCSMGCSL